MIASASGWGRGKVILLGEHAVVYGHPALAGAIDLGVRITILPGRLELAVPAWGLVVDADDDHPAAAALRLIADEVAARAAPPAAITMDDGEAAEAFLARLPASLRGEATVPAAAGLGSSAALAVAMTRALAAASAVVLADDEVVAIANAAERPFHARPSGIDVALAAGGGIGLFRIGAGLRRIDAPPLRLAVGLTGEPRRTAAMVERVAAATQGRADDPRLVALGAAATAGAADLAAGDLDALGARLDAAHAVLADLGVSTPRLDELVTLARGAGALGAKLTGAGGGGAVIALAPGREDEVLAAWRGAGVDTRLVTVGGVA